MRARSPTKATRGARRRPLRKGFCASPSSRRVDAKRLVRFVEDDAIVRDGHEPRGTIHRAAVDRRTESGATARKGRRRVGRVEIPQDTSPICGTKALSERVGEENGAHRVVRRGKRPGRPRTTTATVPLSSCTNWYRVASKSFAVVCTMAATA